MVKAVFMERVQVIDEYEAEIHSPSMQMRIPSVIALKDYVKGQRYPAFTRYNVFLRDQFRCQYCDESFHVKELTFDHVIPRSLGGQTTWDNIVAACMCCNLRKGNYRLRECGMRLNQDPYRPTTYQLQHIGRKFPPDYLHRSWADYLYWDSTLEN